MTGSEAMARRISKPAAPTSVQAVRHSGESRVNITARLRARPRLVDPRVDAGYRTTTASQTAYVGSLE
jgi:hypothetical protein